MIVANKENVQIDGALLDVLAEFGMIVRRLSKDGVPERIIRTVVDDMFEMDAKKKEEELERAFVRVTLRKKND